ncbi:dnaJ [Symbiodinium sp. CCMP2456]|nr:dnaJ [Symbiodinium sp. CCMP2456]
MTSEESGAAEASADEVSMLRTEVGKLTQEMLMHRQVLEQCLEVRESVLELLQHREALVQCLELREGVQAALSSTQIIGEVVDRTSELDLSLAGVSDNTARHGRAIASLTEQQRRRILTERFLCHASGIEAMANLEQQLKDALELVEVRDLQIQGLQAEITLLRRQLAQTPGPCPSVSEAPNQAKRPRLPASTPPAPAIERAPAVAALGFWDALLAKELVLAMFLGYLSSPTFVKLENLSGKSLVVLKRHWPRCLDLSEVGKVGGACWFPTDNSSSFHSLLAQPKWKQAKVLRFPATWLSKERSKYGRKHVLTEDMMKAISRHLPELEEIDLFPYEGSPWTGVDSRIDQFGREIARLQNFRSLKMELWDWRPLRILQNCPNLRVVHFRCPPIGRGFDAPGTPFQQLRCLQSLEELCLMPGSRRLPGGLLAHDGELQNLLRDCQQLRKLDVVPFWGWTGQILPSLAAHPRLENLALVATPSMDLANGLNQLCTSNSLKQIRVVQSSPVLANPPPCRIKIVVESVSGF